MSERLVDIVILPTKEKSDVSIDSFGKMFHKNKNSFIEFNDCTNQHIYILSNEKIKEGDCYLTFAGGDLSKCIDKEPRFCESGNWNFEYCRKIIATTDINLLKVKIGNLHTGKAFEYEPMYAATGILELPLSFIELYIERYNVNNQITEAFVEYDDEPTFDGNADKYATIHINKASGKIDIKPYKHSFTKAEIKNALHRAELADNKNYSGIWKIIEKNL